MNVHPVLHGRRLSPRPLEIPVMQFSITDWDAGSLKMTVRFVYAAECHPKT